MKNKFFLVTVIALVLVCLLAFTAAASDIDYGEKATLADGAIVPVYDEQNNPLIWYVSGVDNDGKNIYASVPNNRNSANSNNETYVTYTINTSWMTQLENINIHIWNDVTDEYEIFTEESIPLVVVNLRGLSEFEYINKGLKISDIQYIYFNENLKDFCEYFKGSTSLRLVDLSACTNLKGGFGGVRNLYNCVNLHTIRLASGTEYNLTCSANNNWRFSNTAITEIVIPSNIVSIGVDNFKNCALLESIYILGNKTSLGQRNFFGCTALTNIYILGDNPEIEITSFKENFYECVDGKTTYDFTGVGKYFFFVSTNEEYLNQVKEAIGATAVITYADYVASPSSYEEGRYVVSGTSICDVYYGEHSINVETANACAGFCDVCGYIIVNHIETENMSVNVEYSSFLTSGIKTTKCNNLGCTYVETEKAHALFTCLGYSVAIRGNGGISIAYTTNNTAISEYASITGNTVKYGVFAVSKDKLGEGDVFGKDGTAANGVIFAEISSTIHNVFEIKVVGFTDEQKDVKLALGAYVAVSDWENTEYFYMQSGSPAQGEKYCFVSYNDVLGAH